MVGLSGAPQQSSLVMEHALPAQFELQGRHLTCHFRAVGGEQVRGNTPNDANIQLHARSKQVVAFPAYIESVLDQLVLDQLYSR